MRFFRQVAVLLVSATILFSAIFSSAPSSLVSATPAPLVIIDAGHGGIDGGAVGASGTLEKDLNLAIATELARHFREAGVAVLLTRSTDTLVLKEGEDVKGARKAADLYNRVEIANAYPDATFISIHMNSYPVSKYRGLQVYYNKASTESARLAYRITDKVKADLDPVYTRVPNFRGDALYLLANAKGCAVLVECGFISNAGEEAKLLEKDYQKKLSFCIFYAIMEE